MTPPYPTATGRPHLQWEVGQWLGEGGGWSLEQAPPPLRPSSESSAAGWREHPRCNTEDLEFDIYSTCKALKHVQEGYIGSIIMQTPLLVLQIKLCTFVRYPCLELNGHCKHETGNFLILAYEKNQ